jgi:uncharacterized protein YcbX
MHVSDLYIYPIKSCRGIRLSTAQAEPRGFRYDRRWMLVTEDGMFMTQRKYHRMALIDVSIDPPHLVVKAPKMTPLSLPLSGSGDDSLIVQIWDDVVTATGVSKEADKWFSDFLGRRVRLMTMPEDARRSVKAKYAIGENSVSFADAFPYLLISQASLDDLNRRLTLPVPMNRFRPNIVIEGCGPYEEDRMRVLLINDVTMHVAKPCSRCVLTTVDQETGEIGKEPLRTLATFRSFDSHVLFGQNLIATTFGEVKVGDSVDVVDWKKESPSA